MHFPLVQGGRVEHTDQLLDDVLVGALQRQSPAPGQEALGTLHPVWFCLLAALANWDSLLGHNEDVPGSPAELAAELNHVGSQQH